MKLVSALIVAVAIASPALKKWAAFQNQKAKSRGGANAEAAKHPKTFNPGTVNEKPPLCGVDLDLAAGDFATIVGSRRRQIHLFSAIAGSFMWIPAASSWTARTSPRCRAQAQPEHRPPVSGSSARHRPT